MKHEMKLNNWSFERIKNVTKTIELWLNGEKNKFSGDIKILCKKQVIVAKLFQKQRIF